MNYPNPEIPIEGSDPLRNDMFIAEKNGKLTPGQLQVIYDRRWFHLFVPNKYGGLNLSLPEAIRLEENISYVDGSVGWVVTLCAGAAMFAGYFEEDLARRVFTDQSVCLAGSGKPNGIAKSIEGGFEINGTWPYASGAAHATHFTANCIIENTGEIHSFIFCKEEVTLSPDWNYLGLNATSGYSFSVKDLKVPADRTFMIDPLHAYLPDPVYRYPFLQVAEATIAATMSGMCNYFFDLAGKIIANKQTIRPGSDIKKTYALELLNTGKSKIRLLRNKFYDEIDRSWSSHISGTALTTTELNSVSATSLELAQQARMLVNELYAYCGMEAAQTNTVINQVWRNINTASQHTLLS
ncbi:MAG TPA: hypothetical protein VK616_04235 [Flavitalea sp.]|nr:hypothetical protein [Flavitalea sp.]